MKLSRRAMLAGAAAVPAIAVPATASARQWKYGHGTMLLYDPELEPARRLAAADEAWQRDARPIEGDTIRFARDVFARRPAVVRGISRQGHAVLIEEVGAEAGYERVALEVEGDVLSWTLMPRLRAQA